MNEKSSLESSILDCLELLRRGRSASESKYAALATLERLGVDARVIELIDLGWQGGSKIGDDGYEMSFYIRRRANEIGIDPAHYSQWTNVAQVEFEHWKATGQRISENKLHVLTGVPRKTINRWREGPDYQKLLQAKQVFS